MSYTVEQPIQYTPDPSKFGTLAGGKVWFGVPNGNPASNAPDRIQVYLARQGLSDLPIAQPIDIGPGGVWMYNGSPAQIKVLVPYCVQITNSLGVQKFYSPSSGDEITKFNSLDAEQVAQNVEIAKSLKTVARFADFASTTATIGQQVELICHTTQGDGGGGIFDVVSSLGLAADTGTIAINGSIAFKRVITAGYRVAFFGAAPGTSDVTAKVNATILAAYKSMANILTSNEIYSVYVHFEQGKDYSVLGTILVPPGIIVNLNGSRLLGADGSAGSLLYNPAGHKMFQTARWDGTSIVSNEAAINEVTWRVVGAGVVNGTIQNTNCAFDLINFQEQSLIDGIRFSNVSAPLRMKGCFYARVGNFVPLMVRNSAHAVGQPCVLLHGAAAHEMTFDVRMADVSIGYEVTATNSFSVRIFGSFEEGYSSNSIGIRNNGAYCQSWTVHAYAEGVRKGITTINGGAFFACDFTPAYFSSCEYAVQAGTSGFRSCTFDAVSAPDEGPGIRNLLDFSAENNDVFVRMSAKGRDSSVGIAPFPSNVLTGAGSQVLATSFWRDTTDATRHLAMCDGRLANKNGVGTHAFEGRHIITMPNQVPFWNVTAPVLGTTLVLDSQIVVDESTPLIGHLVVNDFVSGPHLFDFDAIGLVVYPKAAFPVGLGITLSSNAGNYRLTITGLNTNLGTSYSIKGFCRMIG